MDISTADHALEIYSCKLMYEVEFHRLFYVFLQLSISLPIIWFCVVVVNRNCLSLILRFIILQYIIKKTESNSCFMILF